METEAELLREMDRLWPLEGPVAAGPVLSQTEVRGLAGAGRAVVVGRSMAWDARVGAAEAVHGEDTEQIRAGVAQLVTGTRVFLDRAWCAVAGRVRRGIS